MFNRPRPQPKQKPRSGASIKLPQLWDVPTMDQISNVLTQAQKNPDTFIEQMWSVEGMDKMFVLNTKVDDEGDPLWILKETKITDQRTLWEHRSRDCALIHTLIVGECTGEVSSNSGSISDFGTSINLSIQADNEKAEEEKQAAQPQEPMQQNRPAQRDSRRSSSILPKLDHDDAILQGDLAKIQLPMVLQSIQMGKMTGRLAIRSDSSGVDVYFSDGEPQHATDGMDKGNEVILNLVSLSSGKFQFIPDERTVENSVTQKLDSLLMESISLVDQGNFLTKEGLNDEAYVISKHMNMTEQDLQNNLAQGLPLDLNMQYEFMRTIGNYCQFGELLTKTPLKRSEWVPVLFNLVTLGIVSIADTPPQEHVQVEEEQVDYLSLESSLKPITRPETGVLTYPAFQYFLAQECYRHDLCGIPVSLAVFSIVLQEEGKELTNLDVFQVMQTFSTLKRPIDVLGHFQTFEYGIILPNMGARAAANMVQKLQASLASIEFKSGINGQNLMLDFGIAGIPEHCKKLGQIIPAAAQARQRAESSTASIVLYEPGS